MQKGVGADLILRWEHNIIDPNTLLHREHQSPDPFANLLELRAEIG